MRQREKRELKGRREKLRQLLLRTELARATQGGASVREHHAVQLKAAPAAAPIPPYERLVRCYSSEGRPIRNLSVGEVERKERAGKMDVHRVDGRIVSARELPPMRKRVDGRIVPVRVLSDGRKGLARAKYTELDFDADDRPLRHRVRFK